MKPRRFSAGWFSYRGRPPGWRMWSFVSTASARPISILEDLWIAPFARRRGLAERLVERLVREGGAQGWRRIEWETGDENLIAQRLYDRIATLDPVKRYRIDLD